MFLNLKCVLIAVISICKAKVPIWIDPNTYQRQSLFLWEFRKYFRLFFELNSSKPKVPIGRSLDFYYNIWKDLKLNLKFIDWRRAQSLELLMMQRIDGCNLKRLFLEDLTIFSLKDNSYYFQMMTIFRQSAIFPLDITY